MTGEQPGRGPIIAIGGTEFVVGAENELLHDYVVAQISAPRRRPRVCLLPTAGGDPEHQIGAFLGAMERRGCAATAISLFRLGESQIDLAGHLLGQDLIYVTGGNMVNLMTLWREHRVDEILLEAHRSGVGLCGYSAGSMCWFEHGISTGSGAPVPTSGLGLLAGSHCVHYRQDPERRRTYRSLVSTGRLGPGLALDDHAAALFRRGQLVETVRSVESALAFEVRPENGTAIETPLPNRLLTPARHPGASEIEEMREIRRLRSRSRRR